MTELSNKLTGTESLPRGWVRSLWGNVSFRAAISIYFLLVLFWVWGVLVNNNTAEGIDELSILLPPDSSYPLGTDQIGRDQLARLASAIPYAVLMSVSGVLLGATIGAFFGITGAMAGGVYERFVIAGTNILLGLPSILLAILIVGVLGTGRTNTILAVSVIYIPEFARLGRVLSSNLRESGFVIASRLMGFGQLHILFRHILPNLMPSLVVLASVSLSTALLAITALSFLGLGVVPPEADLGNLLSQSLDFVAIAPWLLIAPALLLVCLVIAANLLGDAFSWLLDAKQSS